jgi:NAD(P)-dependent dehydrogenase (short-subunit alcohol dehydrogenase family)
VKSSVDRVAVIAGAGSGVGRALAFQLAQQGCHLVLADMDGEALEQPRVLITDRQDATRVEPSTYVVDVSDSLAMQRFSEQVSAKHGPVNLLFNNVG